MLETIIVILSRDTSAIQFDRVAIPFVLASFFHWLQPLTDKGGKETGVPGENPRNTSLEHSQQIVTL